MWVWWGNFMSQELGIQGSSPQPLARLGGKDAPSKILASHLEYGPGDQLQTLKFVLNLKQQELTLTQHFLLPGRMLSTLHGSSSF